MGPELHVLWSLAFCLDLGGEAVLSVSTALVSWVRESWIFLRSRALVRGAWGGTGVLSSSKMSVMKGCQKKALRWGFKIDFLLSGSVLSTLLRKYSRVIVGEGAKSLGQETMGVFNMMVV